MWVLYVTLCLLTTFIARSYSSVANYFEQFIRKFLQFITEYLPVKIIRDDRGVPFLYRYQLMSWGNNGPGLCIHHFVKSDPDRGFHDHPWNHSLSFILCGGYNERIIQNVSDLKVGSVPAYVTKNRSRWTFNYLNGNKTFHRVMIDDGNSAWTIFAFGPRSKTWNMIGLDSNIKAMSHQIEDNDGGWWKHVRKGIKSHLPLKGQVYCTVDIVLLNPERTSVLLIKRGRDPFEGRWAFPGGRVDPTDKDLMSAALRELKEETNVSDVKLNMVTTIGNNKRDPRGFTVSVIFTGILDETAQIKAGDDAVDIGWFKINACKGQMAFDHGDILQNLCLG